MTLTSLAIIGFCIVAEITRELCFKRGVMTDEASGQDKSFLRMVLTSPWLLLGIVFWGAGLASWIVVLEDTPLHIAFPIMSLVFVGMPAASRIFFRERMAPRQWLGAALICAGVAMIGFMGT